MRTPTYWATDSNKTPDLLDFFVLTGISSESMEVEPSYDLSSDHSSVIATVCSYAINKTPISKLHNQKTNWEEYRIKLNKSKCENQEPNGNGQRTNLSDRHYKTSNSRCYTYT
jgi:hypothetical protein